MDSIEIAKQKVLVQSVETSDTRQYKGYICIFNAISAALDAYDTVRKLYYY